MGMESVELVMECEDEFDIKITDHDAHITTTVGELHALCVRLIEEQHQDIKIGPDASDRIMHRVRTITSEVLGVHYDRAIPDAHFVDDLNMP